MHYILCHAIQKGCIFTESLQIAVGDWVAMMDLAMKTQFEQHLLNSKIRQKNNFEFIIKPSVDSANIIAYFTTEICWNNFPGPVFHLQFADFPDPMLYSDYLPELSRHVSCSGPAHPELRADQVSWEDLLDMDLPSFRPAFLVLCRVLLNVIHECLKLRLEQRPAGEPSLLSIKQASSCLNTYLSIRILSF